MTRHSKAFATLVASLALTVTGCGLLQSDSRTDDDRRAADEKTRDEVAKATERAKPELEKAGRKLKEAAETAAEQAHAAAQGVKDGWQRGGHASVDLNSASASELKTLPGITDRRARQIIAERPYNAPHDLVDKGVMSEDTYAQIRDRVTAR